MKGYDLRDIFQKIELELIASMKRTLGLHKREEQKEGFRWEQWQTAKLRSIQQFRKNNQSIINKYSGAIEKAVEDTLNNNFNKGQSRVTGIINKIKSMFNKKKASFEFPENIGPKTNFGKLLSRIIKPEPPKETSFFGVNENKLKALIDATQNDLKTGQGAMLRMVDDVYRQTIFKAHVFLQSGASTLYQAVDMATKDFLEKGINCIQYKDGKRVNIASYAEMALRTASQRATFIGEGKKRDEFGVHTVVVSAHANTCKLCLPWQGKILIDDVYSHGSKADGDYALLSEAMKTGLLHPNCRHTLITYFEGITQLPKVPKDNVINTNYAAEQKQRYMERQIRKYKRIEAGELDPANIQKASAKVKEWQSRLRQHLENNKQLRRDDWRESNPGISDKDIKDNKQLLKEKFENAKIEKIRDFIKSDGQSLSIEPGRQGKHIIGHNNYIEGRSYLTISMDEAQELVNKYAGTGEIRFNSKGEWDKKEIIKADKNIGVNVNNKTHVESNTNRFKIHYSNKGVHIVPMAKE